MVASCLKPLVRGIGKASLVEIGWNHIEGLKEWFNIAFIYELMVFWLILTINV